MSLESPSSAFWLRLPITLTNSDPHIHSHYWLCLCTLLSMCACHSIRDRSCWCSYSPRNGIWNCQNFWSPCREARPTLICRPSWKRWAKSQPVAQAQVKVFTCCKCRISHANWMTFPLLYPHFTFTYTGDTQRTPEGGQNDWSLDIYRRHQHR